MNKIVNIIFDLDGTLIDSQIDIKESFKNAIYKLKGQTVNDDLLKIGPPPEEMIRTVLTNISEEEIVEIITTFRFIYRNSGFTNTICYCGIDKLLQILKKQGKHIYLATNKPYYLTKAIIEKLDIHYFDDICTSDAIEGNILSKRQIIALLIGKNKIDPNVTIMVGDTSSDIKSANDNGITSLGVGYGYETKEQIMEGNPDYYFDTVPLLTDFFKK